MIKGEKMITSFGKFCRNLRMDNNEQLHQMAEKLNVSSAFLSKVEYGKAKPPEKWEDTIPSLYNLSESQKEELCLIIEKHRRNDEFIKGYNKALEDMLELSQEWKDNYGSFLDFQRVLRNKLN